MTHPIPAAESVEPKVTELIEATLNMVFRQLQQVSVLLLYAQPMYLSKSMTNHLVKMAESLEKSDALSSSAASDEAISTDFAAKAKSDAEKSEAMEAEAVALEAKSKADEAIFEQDVAKEEYYEAKALREEGKANGLYEDAAVSEKIYQEDMEKVLAETSEAAEEIGKTESDAAVTGMCEVIPLLDIVCDVVGGVAAIGFESHASELTAKSVIDAGTAAATKETENGMIAEADAMQGEAEKDADTTLKYAADAEKYEALAQTEKEEAKKDEEQSAELMEQSRTEESMSDIKGSSAEEEEAGAATQWSKFIEEASEAFFDAVISFFAALFFFGKNMLNIITEVVVPGAIKLVAFVPSTFIDKHGAPIQNRTHWMSNMWRVLPRKELSYASLHFLTLIIATVMDGTNFAQFNELTSLHKGNVIIAAAIKAAVVQSAALVAIYHMSRKNDSRSYSSLDHVKPFFTFLAYFVMELCILKVFANMMGVDLFAYEKCTGMTKWLLFVTLAVTIFGSTYSIILLEKDLGTTESNDPIQEEESTEVSQLLKKTTDSLYTKNDEETSLEPNRSKEEVQARSRTQQSQLGWFDQFLNDLQLPFEILVVVTMVAILKPVCHILLQLLPQMSKNTNKIFHLAEILATVIVIAMIWKFVFSKRVPSHVRVWTGQAFFIHQ